MDKYVRQFHAASDGKGNSKIEQMHYLGKLDSRHNKTASEKPGLVGARMRSYFSQEYNDGTVCDLTNRPRQATVYFVCSPEMPSTKWSLKVNERASCVYDVVVESSLPCSHHHFEAERISAEQKRQSKKLSPIRCSLIDTAAAPQLMTKWQRVEDEPLSASPSASGELARPDGSAAAKASKPTWQLKVSDCYPGGACALSLLQLSSSGRLLSMQPGLAFLSELPSGPSMVGGWGDERTQFGMSMFRVLSNKSLEGVYTSAQSAGRTGREEATPLAPGAGLAGLYEVRGSQPADQALPRAAGWHYTGLLKLKLAGPTDSQSFICTWVVGQSEYSGIGSLSDDGDTLVVGWGTKQIRLVKYHLGPERQLIAETMSYNSSAEWDGSTTRHRWARLDQGIVPAN